ncbi:MAG TPA: VWA domain-containing protein, partial [Acidobacteriota bacterium]|nr:VWA domain-containing protein [Acidobacteriota bacterium]
SVDLPCVVTDRSGQFVADLTQADFVVRDNGKIRKITVVKSKQQAPLSIALVLDRSRSVTEAFSTLQAAAKGFLTSVVRSGQDRACLVAFDSHVYLLQDWTDHVDELAGMITKLTASGGTGLFDAIYKTCRDKFAPDSQDEHTKVLVLVTDGEDTTSHATFKQVVDMVSQSGVFVYVLCIKPENSLNPRELQSKRILGELRDITGGEILYPAGNENRIDRLFDRIQNELRHEYIVTFTSNDEPDGKFHKVKLEATRRDLEVRTRKEGYLASE